jgi:putative flavoprotein involved in K+ transport
VATGPFQRPFTPGLAGQLAPSIFQMHSTGYRHPRDVPAGTVLVVGGGNTGFQIAAELAGTRAVHLSVGSRQTPLPQRIWQRDLFWWLTKTALLNMTVDSRLGRRLSERETLIGSSPKQLRRRGVDLHPRAVSVSDTTVSFAEGRLRHHRGVTDVPGLDFLGLHWQHTRGSALLGWVKDDAAYIATQIQTLANSREARPTAANRAHPDAGASPEESNHADPQ